MPDQLLHEQILLYGLDKDLVTVDSVLMLMDMFAMPYKAVVPFVWKAEHIIISRLKSCWSVGSADVMESIADRCCKKRCSLTEKNRIFWHALLEKVGVQQTA